MDVSNLLFCMLYLCVDVDNMIRLKTWNKHKITIFDQKDTEDVDIFSTTESLNQVISDITS